MTKLLHTRCPHYSFDADLNLEQVSNCIDRLLFSEFKDNDAVIRGIQSAKHKIPRESLVQQILDKGTDRSESFHEDEVDVTDKRIDLFGYACKIVNPPIVLPILEGFHKWKPKSLEKPQRKVDIWMIYDAGLLENIEYNHSKYCVKSKDGYRFIDFTQKTKALLGVITID